MIMFLLTFAVGFLTAILLSLIVDLTKGKGRKGILFAIAFGTGFLTATLLSLIIDIIKGA